MGTNTTREETVMDTSHARTNFNDSQTLPVLWQRPKHRQTLKVTRAPQPGRLVYAFDLLSRRGTGQSAWAAPFRHDPIAFLLDAMGDAANLWAPTGVLLYQNRASVDLGLGTFDEAAVKIISAQGRTFERRCLRHQASGTEFLLEIIHEVQIHDVKSDSLPGTKGSATNSIADRQSRRTQAPEFTLPAADGQPVSSRDYRGRNLVVAFYPADWSPVCASELALIQETLNDIHGRNAEVLGISVDNCFSHRAWSRVQHLGFPLLADFWPHGAVARRYGVFRDSDGMAQRSLFFIDRAGELRAGWVAADQSVAPGLNIIFDTLDRMGQAGQQGVKVHHDERQETDHG
jgi:peroxiredoxin